MKQFGASIGLIAVMSLGLSLRAGAATDNSAADAVLQSYINAMGGTAAMARIENRNTESTLSSGWLSMQFQSHLMRPDKFEDHATILMQESWAGFDGTTGWTQKGSKVELVQGDELQRSLRGHTLDWPGHYATWYPVRQLLPDGAVNGVKVHVVEMTASTGEKEVWRFDAATGLLLQLNSFKFEKGKEPVGTVLSFSDYRKLDGLTLPYKMTGSDGSHDYTLIVKSMTQNQPMAPIRFPSDKAPAAAKP